MRSMNAGYNRDGPGTKGRGRGGPGKTSSTPDRTPTESKSAFPYGSRKLPVGQISPSAVGNDSPNPPPPIWDSGWQADRGFRVRTIISCAPDGGIRRSWVQKMLFGPATASLDSAADLADDDDAADGLAGVREPLPRPGGPGSSSAEAEVGPSADRIPDPVFSG